MDSREILAHLHRGINLDALRNIDHVRDILLLPNSENIHNLENVDYHRKLPGIEYNVLGNYENCTAVVDEQHEELQTINKDGIKLIYAGGSLTHDKYETADVDVFIIAESEEESLQIINQYITLLPKSYICVTNTCVNIFCRSTLYQIVLKYFRSPEHVINSFDLNICMAYTDGTHTYGNTACAFGIMYNCIIPDFTKVRKSFLARIKKYISNYGLGLYTDGLNVKPLDCPVNIQEYNDKLYCYVNKSTAVKRIADRVLHGVITNPPIRTGNYFVETHISNYVEKIFKNITTNQKVFSPELYAFYYSKLLDSSMTMNEIVDIAMHSYEPVNVRVIDYTTLPPDEQNDGSILFNV